MNDIRKAEQVIDGVASDDCTSIDWALIQLVQDLRQRLAALEQVAVIDWTKGR